MVQIIECGIENGQVHATEMRPGMLRGHAIGLKARSVQLGLSEEVTGRMFGKILEQFIDDHADTNKLPRLVGLDKNIKYDVGRRSFLTSSTGSEWQVVTSKRHNGQGQLYFNNMQSLVDILAGCVEGKIEHDGHQI